MRRLSWILYAVAGALALSFGLSNREAVELRLWPLGQGLVAPLFVVIVAAAAVGSVAGAVLAWRAGRGGRRDARSTARQIRGLERDLANARQRAAAAERRAADAQPRALPDRASGEAGPPG